MKALLFCFALMGAHISLAQNAGNESIRIGGDEQIIRTTIDPDNIPTKITLEDVRRMRQAREGGSDVGNGGDPLKDRFMAKAKETIFALNPNSQAKVYQMPFSSTFVTIQQMLDQIDDNVIKLRSEILVDNGGSEVISLAAPDNDNDGKGIIVLQRDKIEIFLDSGEEEKIKRHIIHEIFRSLGIDDDNYVATETVLRNRIGVRRVECNFRVQDTPATVPHRQMDVRMVAYIDSDDVTEIIKLDDEVFFIYSYKPYMAFPVMHIFKGEDAIKKDGGFRVIRPRDHVYDAQSGIGESTRTKPTFDGINFTDRELNKRFMVMCHSLKR